MIVVRDPYDELGVGYASARRPDARLVERIEAALGAGTVVDVGAGTGSSSQDRRDRAGPTDPTGGTHQASAAAEMRFNGLR
ncbi:hypothetical protein [Pseudonocardia endophytica]|uniref:Methyltransferase family protein n=1 Tax=Pseudonocardia endophytica TaxID=401976 RepID=A0A4R1HJY8_PSEEN|nr:hypothetical protein [Pseudonocardia endophytica]TCK21213.1 hypothetical protein EV378_5192 [Pseudonocardia endophytica]